MMRILFVDDEPRILDGLQRMLRPRRHEWEMHFAPGGDAALARLAEQPFDVIVSDMRMPGMDGAALLSAVRERYPDVTRIVLSGHTEMEAALRAVPVAHQFLTKPCDPATLSSVIERVRSLKELLENQALRQAVGQIDQLPPSPRLYQQLTQALQDPDVSLAYLAGIVEQDVSMAAKCLQLVNSAFFGLARRVQSIDQAIAYLGTSMLRTLVLSSEVFRAFDTATATSGFSRQHFERHTLLTGRIARRLLDDRHRADEAFMAGMLHSCGTLVLATRQRRGFASVMATAKGEQRPIWDVEREVFGVTHAEVGAYLLGLWGLPHPITEAVAIHHTPNRLPTTTFDPSGAVYAACALADEAIGAHPERPGLDEAYLEVVGVLDQLPAWRQLAADLAAEGED